jgi:hypothetical protein
MGKITLKAIEELKKIRNCFKSTIGYQKYEVNVFDALNERYIEAGKIIDEFERGQKDDTRKSNCNIPLVSQRSELLAFAKEMQNIGFNEMDDVEKVVDIYIKANCC